MFALKKMITATALTFAALSAQAATVTFSAPTVTNGSSVSVNVIASDFTDLYGYQMSIGFDQTLLQFTSIVEGNYFSSAFATDFGNADDSSTSGTIEAIYGGPYGTTGITGSGTLFTLNFTTLAAGTSFLSFSDLLFFDSTADLADIPFTATDGSLTILPVVDVPPGPGTDVPEPASALLLGIGAAAFLARRRGAAQLKLAA